MKDRSLDNTALKKRICKYLDEEKFQISEHAAEEMGNDHFDIYDILHVLRYGAHAGRYDVLKVDHWRYAIEGRTENGKWARVIIKCQEEMLIIITVFKISK